MQRMPECYNHRNRHLSQLVQQYQEFLLNISRVDNCLPLNIKVIHLLSSNTKFHSYQVTHCLLFKIKMSHSYKKNFKQNYHTWVYFKNLELSVYNSRIDIVTNLYRTSGGMVPLPPTILDLLLGTYTTSSCLLRHHLLLAQAIF